LPAGADWGGAGFSAVGSGFGAAPAVASVPLVQAAALAKAMVSGRARQIFNHRGHGGTKEEAARIFILGADLFMVLPAILSAFLS